MILDVMMPNMDGTTLCKQLRESETTANLPIIMLSGKAHFTAQQEGLDAGADYYMTKPMDTQKLFSLLETYCKKQIVVEAS